MPSIILHIDMDAFFASVEQRDKPVLQGKPVVVAGYGRRGVVSAASYEARVYGIRSAMPTYKALQLCPGLIVRQGDYELYSSVSAQIMLSLKSFSDKLHAVSLDESFLDITGYKYLWESPQILAKDLRKHILDVHGLASSIGIASSPLVAKIASEKAKPIVGQKSFGRGKEIVYVRSGAEKKFLCGLPVTKIPGIGPVTSKSLFRFGIETVQDLATIRREILIKNFGIARGHFLYSLGRGNIHTVTERATSAKSLSQEVTFEVDLYTKKDVERELVQLVDVVTGRLRGLDLYARRVGLKLKDRAFKIVRRSCTTEFPIRNAKEFMCIYREMLREDLYSCGIRLVGISATGLGLKSPRQLQFDFGSPPVSSSVEDDAENVDSAIDEIRDKFGQQSIQFATSLVCKSYSRGR